LISLNYLFGCSSYLLQGISQSSQPDALHPLTRYAVYEILGKLSTLWHK